MTLTQRLAECQRMMDAAPSLEERALYRAEFLGLLVAGGYPHSAHILSPREHEWFERGLRDGQVLLRIGGRAA